MFNIKKSFSVDKIDTLIGKNTSFEGTLKVDGTIRVDGSVKGEIIVTGNIVVSEGSTIEGNIKANNAHVAGVVNGNITAESHLYMTSTAKVNGDVVVKNIVIDEGAVFVGNCKAIPDDAANSHSYNKGSDEKNSNEKTNSNNSKKNNNQ